MSIKMQLSGSLVLIDEDGYGSHDCNASAQQCKLLQRLPATTRIFNHFMTRRQTKKRKGKRQTKKTKR